MLHSVTSTAGRAPASAAPRRGAAHAAARLSPPAAPPASSRRGLLLGLIATAGAAAAATAAPRPALAADAKKDAAAAPKSLADLPRAQFEGLADPNGDGKVTLDELRAFSKQLAEAESLPAPDEKQLDFTSRLYDLNSDGTLGTEELLRHVAPICAPFLRRSRRQRPAAAAAGRSPPRPLVSHPLMRRRAVALDGAVGEDAIDEDVYKARRSCRLSAGAHRSPHSRRSSGSRPLASSERQQQRPTLAAHRRPLHGRPPNRCRQNLAQVFDRDGNERISLEEFKAAIGDVGKGGEVVQAYVFSRVDSLAGTKGSGGLGLEDFYAALSIVRSAVLGY